MITVHRKYESCTPIPDSFIDEYMPKMKISGVRIFIQLCRTNGCSGSELRHLTGLSKQGFINGTTELLKFDVIKKKCFTPEEAKDLLFNDAVESTPFNCNWCKRETNSFHHHHYPIPSKDGGKDTVRICTDCHQQFHTLVDHGIWFIKGF